jgi:biofilm protein TabA
MITGQFKDWKNQTFIDTHPIWEKIFQWLEDNSDTLEIGRYDLPFGECFVCVMAYDLKSREEANFESHLQTIDLQMTLENAEGIEWQPTDLLTPRGEYKGESDFQFYETPLLTYGLIENRVGIFTLLFPEDGHQPQRSVDDYTFVKKLVVKIPTKSVKKRA